MRLRSKFIAIAAVPLVGVIVLIPLAGVAAVEAGGNASDLGWFIDFGLLVMTASLFAVLVGSEQVLKPLKKLATGHEVQAKGNDEVAELARTIAELRAAATARTRPQTTSLVVVTASSPDAPEPSVAVQDIVREELREVEDGDGIDVGAMTRMDVTGNAVAGVRHAVREVVENALRSSSLQTPLIVSGRRDRGGYSVTIVAPAEGGTVAALWLPREVICDPAFEVAGATAVSATIAG